MKEINEDLYKPDFDILDRYLNFSSELLRLSLLGIGGFGTLLLLQIKNEAQLPFSEMEKWFFFASIIFLGLCSGLCLAHRFFASDSMSYHISYLRSDREEERIGRNRRLKWSSNVLILSEITFGVGVFCFALGIFLLLFT